MWKVSCFKYHRYIYFVPDFKNCFSLPLKSVICILWIGIYLSIINKNQQVIKHSLSFQGRSLPISWRMWYFRYDIIFINYFISFTFVYVCHFRWSSALNFTLFYLLIFYIFYSFYFFEMYIHTYTVFFFKCKLFKNK